MLLQNGINLDNGNATVINCRSRNCISKQIGMIKHSDRSLIIILQENLRKACQTQVNGDVKVTKFNCFWGEDNEIVWIPENEVIGIG